ncbi:MAG TPA: DUF551 domain-containing protein [Cyclobacteriaceae bacterium]|jgi:hypothetical protein|nr:DUF551 domain-containing protein [Cyclobacteriaceae bacterium]
MNWINVKDRMPDKEYVLVTDGVQCWTSKYYPEYKHWTAYMFDNQEPGYRITHWMHFKDIPKP